MVPFTTRILAMYKKLNYTKFIIWNPNCAKKLQFYIKIEVYAWTLDTLKINFNFNAMSQHKIYITKYM